MTIGQIRWDNRLRLEMGLTRTREALGHWKGGGACWTMPVLIPL